MRSTNSHGWILLLTVGFLVILCNCGLLICVSPGLLFLLVPCVVVVNALPLLAQSAPLGKQLWFLTHGNYCLKVFVLSTIISVIFQIILGLWIGFEYPIYYLINVGICYAVLAVTFYLGIGLIYCTSFQLGLKLRILGICMGLVPIANILLLLIILRETDREIAYETEKELLNQRRKDDQICRTRYPILLVHGVFFRDYKYFGYWGRIPGQLRRNGAQVYFGNQPSAASIADCAQVLTQRIRQITEETGCEKVNIIAHSKGGLDCRYAMAFCGAASMVASITTINTPHRGSRFADYLLLKAPKRTQNRICNTYNWTLSRLGEPEADLMTATLDLTTEHCTPLDQQMPCPEGVLCRSVGSKMNKPTKGRFPMNFTGVLMKHIQTDNDGIVGADSFQWGQDYQYLTIDSPIGISHCDIIDLNRTNLPGFDVREFYVQMVSELREQGL